MSPVIILNALFCTDSRISSSVSVQLQNTILAYSRPGRMKRYTLLLEFTYLINILALLEHLTFYQHFR